MNIEPHKIYKVVNTHEETGVVCNSYYYFRKLNEDNSVICSPISNATMMVRLDKEDLRPATAAELKLIKGRAND